MPTPKSYKFTRTIQAPAAEVYRAFTNASALREWLCDRAQANARKRGALYHGWNSGTYAFGEFVALDPNKRIVFDWEGRGDPGKTRVSVTLKANGDKSVVTLAHTRIGTDRRWKKFAREIEKDWNEALDNLQSVLETGQDLRLVRRPMMGLSGSSDLTAEAVAETGVPVKAGVRLDGTVEGFGAHKAGLQKDNVIVGLGGKKVTNFGTLIDAIQPHRAGDKVKVVYYRGAQKLTTTLELSPRPIPTVPMNKSGFAEALRKLYSELDAELAKAFEGGSEADAAQRTTPGAWSAKDTVAHLIAIMRDAQAWIAALLEGDEGENIFPSNALARLSAMVGAFGTIPALLGELARNEAEIVAFIANLPDEFVAHKGAYWRIGYQLLTLDTHSRDHFQQIRAAIEAAKKN